MKKQIILAMAGIAALTLAGCGGSGDKEKRRDGGGAAKVASDDDWDATNACAILDKAVLGAALKDNVTETSLGLVNQASGPNAATSECTYMLASGGRASLMTRRSPIDDNTPEAMEMARKTSAETLSAFGKTLEDVPGVGKAAFFVPGINQLNVFLDSNKFVILTIGTAPETTAKETAIELVKTIMK